MAAHAPELTPAPPEWTFDRVERVAADLEPCTASEVLRWSLETFGSRLVIASSFGAEDVVLIDLAVQIDPKVRIFTLDTGRLPQETYDVMERLRQRYGVRFEVLFPDPESLGQLLADQGPNGFYRSIDARRACCGVRKVEPLRRVLSTADAWVTGLRREQAVTRADIPKAELDLANGRLVKINPLAGWSEDDVWNHIREHNVPYNLLHDMGYPSIGCAPCTRAVKPGEGVRAGRWWWERPEDKECGLHKA